MKLAVNLVGDVVKSTFKPVFNHYSEEVALVLLVERASNDNSDEPRIFTKMDCITLVNIHFKGLKVDLVSVNDVSRPVGNEKDGALLLEQNARPLAEANYSLLILPKRAIIGVLKRPLAKVIV